MEEKKVLLSIKDLWVKFRVRGRVLTAIRNVSLDIYENESIAIVGESGCGKSVLTKTFAGMLDNNGFIDGGSIVFNDETLTEVSFNVGAGAIARGAPTPMGCGGGAPATARSASRSAARTPSALKSSAASSGSGAPSCTTTARRWTAQRRRPR
mgnify:CR=1 FL=1